MDRRDEAVAHAWMGVLDDLPGPAELAEHGMEWLLEPDARGFPWGSGKTVVTSRSAECVATSSRPVATQRARPCCCVRCSTSSPRKATTAAGPAGRSARMGSGALPHECTSAHTPANDGTGYYKFILCDGRPV